LIELTFNVYSLLISIALIIAITFGFLLLFSRHKNKKADRFLAVLLFIVAFWNASVLILDLGIHRYVIGIIWVPLTYTLALGPCYYFYIRYMTLVDPNKKLIVWPHFIPVIIQVALFLIEVYQGIPQRLGYFDTQVYVIFEPIVNALAIVSLMIYGYIARKRIQKYHVWVENNYSHYHRYTLNWLLRLSTIFLIVFTLWLGYFVIDYFLYNYRLNIFEYYPFHLTLAVISIWLSVESFSKPEIIYPDKISPSGNKEASNSIANNELHEQAYWLQEQIETNLLYLDPELSLKSLADTLNLHPNTVSKIINDGLMLTFSDCINQYRIKSVINKLEDRENDQCTFLAIAFDCGFNSKTTFNRVFKKQLGLTPLQYKNNLQKKLD
jgi:AraC-like DNA-binding protein